MNYTSFPELLDDILDRAGAEAAGAGGGFENQASRILVRAYHDICNEHPFLFLRADPPGVIRTVAPIEGLAEVTLDSDVITFAVPPAVSVAGRKIELAGAKEFYRIRTHLADQVNATLDAAFSGETNAAAVYTIYQDEYPLPVDCRHIVAMWVAEDGTPLWQRTEEFLKDKYPDPPSVIWPPLYFARVGEYKIRLAGYPDRARRIELAYTVVPEDIDTDDDGSLIRIPRNFRHVIADLALSHLLKGRNDGRSAFWRDEATVGKEKLIADDSRKRQRLEPGRTESGPYA